VSIPIRIHNDGTKDIRALAFNADGLTVSYRIPPGSCSPQMDVADSTISVTDDDFEVANVPAPIVAGAGDTPDPFEEDEEN